jgi:hypothetical protein
MIRHLYKLKSNGMNSQLLVDQCDELKTRLRAQRDNFTQIHSTRLHRSLSWLKAAGEQLEYDNIDQAFINLWISFSACFYIEGQEPISPFIEKLVALDDQQRIYACLWNEYSSSVKALIKNPYVFSGFWDAQRMRGELKEGDQDSNGTESWQSDFDQSSVDALNYLSRKKVAPLFSIVLDRLYVLRNQVLQGGATYQSRINRDQVSDGTKLLASIMPIIIEIMLSKNDEEWGELAYPVAT